MRYPMLLLLCLLGAACGDDAADTELTEEAAAERAQAERLACLTAELERRAEADLQSLEQMTAMLPAGVGSAREATLQFQRVLAEQAQLGARAAAYTDSALNHAARPADSARYAALAAGFRTRAPEPGTIEANARSAYQQALAELAADPDHPCNW